MALGPDDRDPPTRAARLQLERAMRVMFQRWGEWRVAPPEDAERLKLQIATAEAEFLLARQEVERLARSPAAAPPGVASPSPTARRLPPHVDEARLRATVQALVEVLAESDLPPREVDDVLLGRRHRDASGEIIVGLEDAAWRHSVSREHADVWTLVSARGHTLAKITHGAGEPAWTSASWVEATGELE